MNDTNEIDEAVAKAAGGIKSIKFRPSCDWHDAHAALLNIRPGAKVRVARLSEIVDEKGDGFLKHIVVDKSRQYRVSVGGEVFGEGETPPLAICDLILKLAEAPKPRYVVTEWPPGSGTAEVVTWDGMVRVAQFFGDGAKRFADAHAAMLNGELP